MRSRSARERRPFLARFVRLALILLGGIVLGFGLLALSFLLPIEPMEQNVLLSIPAMDGSWGTGEEPYEQVVKGYQTAQLDNSTDAYMLLSAIHRSDTSLADRVIHVYTYYHDVHYKQYDTLMQYGQTGLANMRNTSTARYWLGYLIVLKPLLLVFTYMDIRMLNAAVQGLLLLGICVLMQRRGVGRYALPFGLSMTLLNPMVTGLSLQFSTVFLVMAVSMLLMLWKPRWVEDGLGDGAFFLLIGMATSYFDFLTYPLAAFGMPCVLWLLLHPAESASRRFSRLLRCGAAWCFGYLGMWAGKWLLDYLYGGKELWYSVVGSVETRTSTEASGQSISRLGALARVLSVYFKKPYLLLGLAAGIGYGAALIKNRNALKNADHSMALALVLVALLPVPWFLLTANHAYLHAFFASRALAVSAFGGLCALSCLTARREERLWI